MLGREVTRRSEAAEWGTGAPGRAPRRASTPRPTALVAELAAAPTVAVGLTKLLVQRGLDASTRAPSRRRGARDRALEPLRGLRRVPPRPTRQARPRLPRPLTRPTPRARRGVDSGGQGFEAGGEVPHLPRLLDDAQPASVGARSATSGHTSIT